MKEPMAFPHCFENCEGARNWIQSSGMTRGWRRKVGRRERLFS